MASRDLLERRDAVWCSVMTWRAGKEAQEGEYIRILIADSCCGTAETNATL